MGNSKPVPIPIEQQCGMCVILWPVEDFTSKIVVELNGTIR